MLAKTYRTQLARTYRTRCVSEYGFMHDVASEVVWRHHDPTRSVIPTGHLSSPVSPESTSNSLSKYYLGNDSGEIHRLNRQHAFLRRVFDYPRLVSPRIDTARVSRVIDVGAGTGVWALDFMSLPDVRDRNVQVFACDISTAKFPRTDGAEIDKMTFFQQDVTESFPDELLGTFDLINLSCLSFALTEKGWKVALKNLYSLLRPGGHLLLRDGDLITYNHENPPVWSEGQVPDITASLQGTSNVAKTNRIFTGEALKRGFVVGLSYRIRKLLEEASFRILSSQRVSVPFGNYCNSYESRNGTRPGLSEYRGFTISNYVQILNSISLAAMNAGDLELADGTRIMTEEGRLMLMKDLVQSVEEGGFMTVSDWVAVRPLGA